LLYMQARPAIIAAAGDDLLQNLKEANQQLYQEIEKANLDNQLAQQTITQQKQEIAHLKEKLENAERPQYAEIDFEIFPEWYLAWIKNGRPDRDGVLLKIIGETGIVRQPEIFALAAPVLGVKLNSSALTNAIESLEKHGFVTVRKADSHSVGQPPNIVTLTLIGQAAYVFYAKARSKSGELDLDAHKNDAHALLILKVADWLKKAGYNILGQGERINLDGGHLFAPDITAEKNDKLIYVEVKRESNKGNQDRETKWRNFSKPPAAKCTSFLRILPARKKASAKSMLRWEKSSRLPTCVIAI
jgi:hypothetical protein